MHFPDTFHDIFHDCSRMNTFILTDCPRTVTWFWDSNMLVKTVRGHCDPQSGFVKETSSKFEWLTGGSKTGYFAWPDPFTNWVYQKGPCCRYQSFESFWKFRTSLVLFLIFWLELFVPVRACIKSAKIILDLS